MSFKDSQGGTLEEVVETAAGTVYSDPVACGGLRWVAFLVRAGGDHVATATHEVSYDGVKWLAAGDGTAGEGTIAGVDLTHGRSYHVVPQDSGGKALPCFKVRFVRLKLTIGGGDALTNLIIAAMTDPSTDVGGGGQARSFALPAEMPTYALTGSAGNNGSIDPTSADVALGGSQVFTVTPDDGFEVDTVEVDDVDVTGDLVDGTYTFTDVGAEHTIAVTFAAEGP